MIEICDNLHVHIHDKVITSIPRFRLVQDDPNTWVLHISQVQRSDGGLYMCQVNTAPLMSQVGSLKVFGEKVRRKPIQFCMM